MFARLSVTNKLVWINLVVVVAALCSMLVFFLFSERSEQRDVFVQELKQKSQMLAAILQQPLASGDSGRARQILATLSSDPVISEMILFDRERHVLAYYSRDQQPLNHTDYAYLYGGRLQWPADQGSSLVYSRQGVFLVVPIEYGADERGGLFVHATISGLEDAHELTLLGFLAIFVVSLLLSVVIMRRMIGLVTDPIHNVLAAVQQVGREGNYNVRVNSQTSDELGALAFAFNSMVQAIGERDSELSKQHLKLEAEVQERTQELSAANTNLEETVKALQQANRAIRVSEENKRLAEASARAKAHFLANMSHELRTPMNGVLGMLSLLNDTELSEEQKEYLHVAYESGHLLLDMINNVLDLSKIEQGKLVLENIPFDLRECMEEVFTIVAESAHGKGLELALDWTPYTPTRVIGDPVRFKQLMLNLVGNAIKFTQRGHVLVMFRLVGDFGNRRRFRFEVCDTGVGIKDEVRELIFEKFSQADPSTTRQYGGTGLGLALCKHLTRMMDGHMGVQSEVGKGSTFWFEVHLRQHETEAPPEQLVFAPGTTRFLLLEPNRAAQSSFSSYLGALGASTDAVTDVESLELQLESASKRYQGVILSLNCGAETIRTLWSAAWLREHFDSSQLLVSGSALQRQKLTVEDRQRFTFINKPLKFQRLRAVLQVAAGSRLEVDSAIQGKDNVKAMLPRKLLVVEDNLVNQQVARGRLEKLGYEVHVAENGAAALEMLDQSCYDLIFMDCQMPVLDGYQATRRIRESEKEAAIRRIPIVAMTAHAMAGDRDQCIQAGMDDYVAKPFRTEQLKAILARWLCEH